MHALYDADPTGHLLAPAQAIRNLVLNAVQAMPGGGTLRYEVRRVRRRPGARGPGRRRGEAARSQVSLGYQQVELGFNYRMTDIQAALGVAHPPVVKVWVHRSEAEKRRLVGAGRTEFAMSIFGRSWGHFVSGTAYKEGREVDISTIAKAVGHGIAYATEDRKTKLFTIGATCFGLYAGGTEAREAVGTQEPCLPERPGQLSEHHDPDDRTQGSAEHVDRRHEAVHPRQEGEDEETATALRRLCGA